MKRRKRNKTRRRRIAALTLAPVTLVAATTTITIAAAPINNIAVAQTARGATLDSGRSAVGHGERLVLSGTGAPGSRNAIEFRRAGGERWSSVRGVTADPAGEFRTRVRPRYSGSYRAVPATGTASAPVPVRVRSRVSVDAEKYTVVGRKLRLSGRVFPVGERGVTVNVGGDRLHTRAGRDGRFSVAWHAGSTGRFRPSVRAAANELAAGDSDHGRKVTVYRSASASWYGPGLYGNRMACGGTLTPGTVGVANKTLPCGTKVHLRLGNRTVTAPVVDRGPFAGDREYDLTAATKQKLGFGSTGMVLTSR